MHNFFSFSRFLFLFYEVKLSAATQTRKELVKKYVYILYIYLTKKIKTCCLIVFIIARTKQNVFIEKCTIDT